jgi:hypothetical protein
MRSLRLCLVAILSGALAAGCGPSGPVADAAATLDGLPLQRGFYVASDTPCAQASNATLALIHREGVNGARDGCTFEAIEQIGPTSYRVTQTCSAFGGGGDGQETSIVVYEIPDETRYTARSDSGWVQDARYCAQSSLPDPWRDNDISDILQ